MVINLKIIKIIQMKRTNIVVRRAILNITQKELANKVNLSRQSIHLIETGQVDPKLSIAARIARFFGMKIEELFNDD